MRLEVPEVRLEVAEVLKELELEELVKALPGGLQGCAEGMR